MRLQMRMSQRLVMTPMLQQAIKMLPMTRLELIQAIRKELDENPLLDDITQEEDQEQEQKAADGTQAEAAETVVEEPVNKNEGDVFEEQASLEKKESVETKDDVDWDAYMQSDLYEGGTGEGYVERPSLENTLKYKEGLEDHLLWQLSCSQVSEEEKSLGAIIIGNITIEGYLDADLAVLAKEAEVSYEEMEKALKLTQSFDPPGICARDLRECLFLQVHGDGADGGLAEKLIRNYLNELDERQFSKLAKTVGASIDEVVTAVRHIRELDPKPGLQYNAEEAHYITPDLYVVKVDNNYQVFLNDDGVPKLRINNYYRSILTKGENGVNNNNNSEARKENREYVENKFRSALWMIKSIEQRRQTMLKVGRSLCKFQREFLDKGVNYLKPLVLRNVAEDIEMHESTVSRVTTNKYMHTPQGLLELKYFFHSSVRSYLGNDMSSVRVKQMIKKICKEENSAKPHTDDQIVKLLQGKDVKIARRTVTKYRKELQIPSTSKRRKLYL